MTDRQKIIFGLTSAMEMANRLQQFGEISEGEDRKLLAHSLFDEIIYDMDRRQIIDFKVKQWAEPFLILRAACVQRPNGRRNEKPLQQRSFKHRYIW